MSYCFSIVIFASSECPSLSKGEQNAAVGEVHQFDMCPRTNDNIIQM